MELKKGSTSVTLYFKLKDPATGVPVTALTITDLDMTYTRNRAAAVKNDVTALALVTSAFSANKMIEVDAANSPGLHRADFPDAAFASGVDKVILTINGAAIDPADKEIILVDNIESDTYSRVGAPVGASISVDIAGRAPASEYDTELDVVMSSRAPANEYDTELDATISSRNSVVPDVAGTAAILHGVTDGKIDILLARLTAARAGYLDELAAANMPADIDTLLLRIVGTVALEATLTAMKGAGWTTETLKAIKDAVDAISGGGGSNAIEFTIQDGDSNNIVGATVEIWDSANTTYITKGLTDSSGEYTENLNAGTYTIRLLKVGYVFTNKTLIVKAAASVTYTGTAIVIPLPSAPNNCIVYEDLFDLPGTTPLDDDVVTAQAHILDNDLPFDSGTMLHTAQTVNGTYDETTGRVYWELPYTAQVVFVIEVAGVEVTKTIPSVLNARLVDIP